MNLAVAREKIEEILDEFDFESVQAHMRLTKWKYFDSPDTPTVEKLRSTAWMVLNDAVRSEHDGHAAVSTGGFEARLDRWDAGQYYLRLSFIPFQEEKSFAA